ncbi:hypothetical protein [Streptomyces sp. AC602_WCS936]|uniref:hypothetical protein n=1 Tax=Streptomyces sp. AC602_WCS936 TaxID=2823685 RepID=UPI001C2577ED|nr:hypothetical protein [Streptomyces sp. AC602_WCS936]
MSRRHRAREPQWGPSAPQASGPPPNDWLAPPPGPPPESPYRAQTGPPPKKRHRVFPWVFLAVQILFLIWVITGAASGSGTPAQCRGRTGDALELCEDASDVGTAIGVWLVIVLWAATDIILGFTYLVFRLARRRT